MSVTAVILTNWAATRDRARPFQGGEGSAARGRPDEEAAPTRCPEAHNVCASGSSSHRSCAEPRCEEARCVHSRSIVHEGAPTEETRRHSDDRAEPRSSLEDLSRGLLIKTS